MLVNVCLGLVDFISACTDADSGHGLPYTRKVTLRCGVPQSSLDSAPQHEHDMTDGVEMYLV